MEPTKDQILQAIEKSGYLMEQEVASILEKLTFNVKTNTPFEDEDLGKSREIDILAPKELLLDTENKLTIYCVLICECKNNKNPFVFIERKKNKYDQNPSPQEFIFPHKKYYKEFTRSGKDYVREIDPFQHLGIKKFHYYYNDDKKAVQFCKISRKGKDWEAIHDNIYDALFYPLIKALNSQIKYTNSFRGIWNYIYLYFPVVILNSDIFSIESYKEDKTPSIVDYISFVREIKSKSISGQFLVDFVNKSKLKSYISTVLDFCNNVVDDYKKNPKKYLINKH